MPPETPIAWYRSPLEREQLLQLLERSDRRAWLQTGSFLGLLLVTGSAACWAGAHGHWLAAVLLVLLHGSFYGFLLNGFHEFCHNSVFKTRWLNACFAHLFSLLSWNNVYWFTSSHTRHHQFTLHPPQDLEVTLPIPFTLRGFLLGGLVNPAGAWAWLLHTIRIGCGRPNGAWEARVLEEIGPAARRQLFNWSWAILGFHVLVVGIALAQGWWLLPFVTTLAPFIGGWLLFLLNNTQHVGLRDSVPDFRLCCRTIRLHPFLEFLYWHMNFHIEHHMYAAVPCYNLRRLHAAIRHDLPPCTVGIVATWREIASILHRQRVEPTYQFNARVPARPSPAT